MNMKSYRGWRVSFSKKTKRFTAKGLDVESQKTEVTAVSRTEIERKVDEYLAPITFTIVEVNGTPTRISSRQHIVKNIMSGKQVVEDKDTPFYLSVSSETYWST